MCEGAHEEMFQALPPLLLTPLLVWVGGGCVAEGRALLCPGDA